MRKYALIVALLLMLSAHFAVAQDYPPLQGNVADGASVLNVASLNESLQVYSTQAHTTFIALTYRSPIDPNVYERGFLQANGFIDAEGYYLKSVILIALNYELGNLGFQFSGEYEAREAQLERIQETFVKPSARNNPNEAFRAGFEQIALLLAPPVVPTNPVIPTVAAQGVPTRVPAQAPTATPVTNTQESSINPWLIVIGGVLLLGVGGIGFVVVATSENRRNIGLLRRSLNDNTQTLKDLTAFFVEDPVAGDNYQVIRYLTLVGADSEEASQLLSTYKYERELTEDHKEDHSEYEARPVSVFGDKSELAWLLTQVNALAELLSDRSQWIVSFTARLRSIEDKIETVSTDLKKTRSRWEQLSAEYRETVTILPYLPSAEDILGHFQETLIGIDQTLKSHPYNAVKTITLIDSELINLEEVLTSLVEAEEVKSDAEIGINTVTESGINITIEAQKALDEVEADRSRIGQALLAQEYEDAKEAIGELASDANRALEAMEFSHKLYIRNNERINALSNRLGAALEMEQKALSAWNVIRAEYIPESWDSVADHYDDAHSLLLTLIDTSDEADRYSTVCGFNHLSNQKFFEAEALLNAMEHDLSQVILILEELIDYQGKLFEARENHQQAIKEAISIYSKADTLRDTHLTETSKQVDALLSSAESLLKVAQGAAHARNYLVALTNAQESHDTSVQAQKTAQLEIDALSRALQEAHLSQTRANAALNGINQEVLAVSDYIVTPETREKVNTATLELKKAENALAEADRHEDIARTQQLTKATSLFYSAAKTAELARESMNRDVSRYNSLATQVEEAHRSAETAITTADMYVGALGAGHSGSENFRKASELLPSHFTVSGSSLGTLTQLLTTFQNVSSLATQAQRDAQSAISRSRSSSSSSTSSFGRTSSSFGGSTSRSSMSRSSGGSTKRSSF